MNPKSIQQLNKLCRNSTESRNLEDRNSKKVEKSREKVLQGQEKKNKQKIYQLVKLRLR